MNKLFDLANKWSLVTGANTGLGQAIALGLAQAGSNLVLVGRSSCSQTLALVQNEKREAFQLTLDLSNTDSIESLMEEVCARVGSLDVLVNNAGTIHREEALEISQQSWDQVLDLNLKSVFFLSQAFAKRLSKEEQAGKIINIASMLSYQGGIRVAPYTASKTGILGLTRALANEWADRRINVNAIAPGYFETNNTQALRDDRQRSSEILSRIPMGRWGKPEDLVGAAVFLSSDAANYITGTTLSVDGGWLAR